MKRAEYEALMDLIGAMINQKLNQGDCDYTINKFKAQTYFETYFVED